MARRTKKPRPRQAPLSPFYRVRAVLDFGPYGKPKKVIAGEPVTQKREAIREANRRLHRLGIGAHAEVRTKSGQLIYQAGLHYGRQNRKTIKVEEL